MQKFRYSPEALVFIAKNSGAKIICNMADGLVLDTEDTINKLNHLATLQICPTALTDITRLKDAVKNYYEREV